MGDNKNTTTPCLWNKQTLRAWSIKASWLSLNTFLNIHRNIYGRTSSIQQINGNATDTADNGTCEAERENSTKAVTN